MKTKENGFMPILSEAELEKLEEKYEKAYSNLIKKFFVGKDNQEKTLEENEVSGSLNK